MKNYFGSYKYLFLGILVSFFSFTQAQEVKIHQIQDDVDEDGNVVGTASTFTLDASTTLNDAFAIPLNNRKTHAGRSDGANSASLNADDLSGARVLTGTSTLSYYRESSSDNDPQGMNFQSAIWEYTGASGGQNEFIVRGRYIVSLDGATNSLTEDLTGDGIVNANDCIPFITGIISDDITDGADSTTAIAYLEDSTTLRVEKGSNASNVDVYITIVEFTGSSWNVYHGDSGDTDADTGTIKLRSNGDGTGDFSTVISWDNTIIFTQHRGDNTTNGVHHAIADNWPVMQPTFTLNTQINSHVEWTFHEEHDSDGTNRHFVHILENSGLNVTRFTDTQNGNLESTIDITSAGLTNLDYSLMNFLEQLLI